MHNQMHPVATTGTRNFQCVLGNLRVNSVKIDSLILTRSDIWFHINFVPEAITEAVLIGGLFFLGGGMLIMHTDHA
jgi:hypothetical protein